MKPNVIYLQQLSHIRIPAVKLKYRRQKHASFLIYIKCQKKGLFTVQSFVHACVIHETRVESSHTNCSMKECGIFLGVYFSPQPILHHLYWYAYCVSIGQKIVAEIVEVYNQLDNLGVEITHHRTQIISIQQLLKLSCKKKCHC